MYIEDQKTGIKYFKRCEVRLIATTQQDSHKIDRYLQEYGLALNDSKEDSELKTMLEVIGRHCYMAFGDKAKSKNSHEYITNIIKHKHFSILEHINFTFLIRGISRFCTHELVRHRHGSYTQFSTRYCDVEDMAVVLPNVDTDIISYLEHCKDCFIRYSVEYNKEIEKYSRNKKGKVPMDVVKAARGVARFYLPSGLEAPITITGNLRTFMEAIDKRFSVHADSEIRNLFKDIIYIIKRIIPESVELFIDKNGKVTHVK